MTLVVSLAVSYWAVRMLGFSGLSDDESEQVMFAQALSWGYDVANPPLYTWMLYGLFAVMGKSAGVVLAFKYAVLAAVYLALFGVARSALGRERPLDAALVALSPALIFFMSWHAVFNYSHAILYALMTIIAYGTLLSALESGRWRCYLAFGFAAGLGLLSKYAFALFLVGLVLAVLIVPRLRVALQPLRFLAALALATAIVSTHVLWLWQSADEVRNIVEYKMQLDPEVSYASGVVKGLWSVARAMFAFLSPFWLLALLAFPAAFRRGALREASIAELLLGRAMAIATLGIVAIVLAGGATQFRPNYLFFLTLLPLWVFLRVSGEEGALVKRRAVYAALVLGGLVASLGGTVGKALIDPLQCRKCQLIVPYAEIAQALRDGGFTGGTIFAMWYPAPLPGNLALHLDDARIVSVKFPHLRPPEREHPGQCLEIWIPFEQGGPIAEDAIGWLVDKFALDLDRPTPVTRLEFPSYRAPDKKVLIEYMLLDPGEGDCR